MAVTLEFTDLAVWWREYAGAYASRSWREYRGLLAEAIHHAPGAPLLDVGCGYGFLVECARRFGIEAVGVEGSEDALAECRARHPLADVRPWSAGTALPLRSDSVGVAVAHEVIDHITFEDNRALFGELWRVLKPDGVLVVKSPSRYNTADQDKGHVTFFSPGEFRTFVREFGFEVITQPYVPRALLGTSRPGWLAMRAVTTFWPRERWAARIDLVARKRAPSGGERA